MCGLSDLADDVGGFVLMESRHYSGTRAKGQLAETQYLGCDNPHEPKRNLDPCPMLEVDGLMVRDVH